MFSSYGPIELLKRRVCVCVCANIHTYTHTYFELCVDTWRSLENLLGEIDDKDRWKETEIHAVSTNLYIYIYIYIYTHTHKNTHILNKIKLDFFQAVTVSILLYACTTWKLTKAQKKLDGKYARMLYAVLSKSWKQFPPKQQLYGHLTPIQVKWTSLVKNLNTCTRL